MRGDRSRCRRRYAIVAATAALIALPQTGIRAHDMPSDVLVQLFVRPSANHLQVLVRLPLISLLNINLPKRGEDFLDLAAIEPSLRDAAKATADAVDFFDGGDKLTAPRTLAVRVSLPSDTSFTSYESALAHLQGPPLPVDTAVVWNQGFFDAMLEYDGVTTDGALALHPYFTMLAPRVVTSVRFLLEDGRLRTFDLNNDPGLVHLDPRWYQTAWTFGKAGLLGLLNGPECLLFLIALAIPIRRFRPMLPVALAFALASSLTLVASAFHVAPSGAWFPPAIAALVAIGIVLMTIDNVFIADQEHRWALAFGFGLAFGFALCFSLQPTLQLAGSHVVTSVVSFTIGVVFGQLLVLAALVPAMTALFRMAISERVGVFVLSALVCHTAWHWMISRITFLTTINWPLSDLIEVMRWGAAVTLVAAAAVLLVGFGRRLHLANRFSVHSTPS